MSIKTLLIEYDDTHGNGMGEYTPITQRDEVVRCRDCEHSSEHDMRAYGGDSAQFLCHHFSMSSSAGWPVEPDGFCAWGERRDA